MVKVHNETQVRSGWLRISSVVLYSRHSLSLLTLTLLRLAPLTLPYNVQMYTLRSLAMISTYLCQGAMQAYLKQFQNAK
jgi:hypothetical protein